MTIRKSKELSGVLGDDVKTRNITLMVHTIPSLMRHLQ